MRQHRIRNMPHNPEGRSSAKLILSIAAQQQA
jgi:hypothetical protein